MTDEELQQILGELRDEPLPFGTVRAEVVSVAARARTRRLVPLWAWSMAAAAALILVTLAWRPALKSESMIVPPAPKLEIRAPVFEVAHKMSVKAVKRSQAVEPAKEAFTVKMLTGDPDVVVYWIVGGGEE